MTELSTDDLVARGRDREAVAAALRETGWHAPSHRRGGPEMDGIAQLDEVVPLLRQVVEGLSPEDYSRATPCTSFTVQGVLEHMVGGATMFAPAFRGGPSPSPVHADGDTLERWQAAMTELLASVHADGARERTIPSPFGELPGEEFARYVAFDGLVHAWDLGRATGRPVPARAELVAAVDAYARGLLVPEMRDGDTFAEETAAPEDASDLDRLAAFSGRTV